MITLDVLSSLLEEYKNKEATFSSDLEAKTVALMQLESRVTLCFLEHLTTAFKSGMSSENVCLILRSYFSARWDALKNTNIAYTRHPFLPINQLCLKIAEQIAGTNESIATILMPTVIGLCRETYSLKSETEESGHFAVEQFILNERGTRLIPVVELFDAGKVNTNLIFSDFQPSSAQVQYQLNSKELARVKTVAGESGKQYMQALTQLHASHYDNHSVGFAIKELATHLKKASVNDAGTENSANFVLCEDAIKTFYDLWRKLPEETIIKINQYRIKNYGNPDYSLESYFLALFVRHQDCSLTEEERAKQKAEDIFPCAQQISDCLNEFLIQNKELYDLNIEPSEHALEDQTVQINNLYQAAIAALTQREQALDADDKGVSSFVQKLMCHFKVFREMPNTSDLWAGHIHNFHTLSLLANTEDFPLREVFSKLRNVPFPADKESFFDFFKVIAKKNPEHIFELISPYQDLVSQQHYKYLLNMGILSETDAVSLRKMIVQKCTSEIKSMDEFYQNYSFWKEEDEVQSLLLDSAAPFLHDLVQDTGTLCSSLLSRTHPRAFYKVFEHFGSQVNSKKEFLACWNVIPSAHHKTYINAICFESFIKSLSELKEITDSLPSSTYCHLVFKQLNAAKLNCSNEEFDLFIQSQLARPAQSSGVRKEVKRMLEIYLASRQTTSLDSLPVSRQAILKALFAQLDDPNTTDKELIHQLREAQEKIIRESTYFFIGQDSNLYRLIEQTLKPYAEVKTSVSDSSSLFAPKTRESNQARSTYHSFFPFFASNRRESDEAASSTTPPSFSLS